MSDRPIVVVGGTGMLAGVVEAFVEQGREVIVPARRPARVGRWVAADWTAHDEFLARVGDALAGRTPDLLVLWCHRPHRAPISTGLAPVLDGRTRIVEVVGTSSWSRDATWARRHLPGSMLVPLGQSPDGTAWLTDDEIARGVIEACDVVEAGRSAVHVVGSLPEQARRQLDPTPRG